MIQVINTVKAATATTVGGIIDVEGAERISLIAHSTGTINVTVEVSFDGTVFVGYNKLISNATNTNGQDVTRIATLAGSATAAMVTFDNDDLFKYIRVTATETGDGVHNVWVAVEYES